MSAARPLPPGPSASALRQTLAWAREPAAYLEESRARHGPIWTSRLVGFPPLVHISDPEAIRQVFLGDPEVFLAGEANRVLEPVLGRESLFVLDGSAHARHRRVVQGAVHGARSEALASLVRAATVRALARWPRGVAFCALGRLQELTLEVIFEAVFGLDDPVRARLLRDDIAELLDGMIHPVLLVRWAQRDLGPLTPWAGLVRVRDAVDARVFALIEERGREPRERLLARDDLLSRLLLEGASLGPRALRDELVTLLVAGHETVATTLAWALHHLTRSPAALARAEREARANDDRGWIDAVGRESMRLTPTLPIVGRRLASDQRVGGVWLPRGARAAPNMYLTHREPALWSEPLRFAPERFLESKPAPHVYFPFGGGARRCVGAAFATTELRVVLETVLRRFTVRAAPGAGGKPVRRGVTLVPAGGVPLIVEDAPGGA